MDGAATTSSIDQMKGPAATINQLNGPAVTLSTDQQDVLSASTTPGQHIDPKLPVPAIDGGKETFSLLMTLLL